MSVCGALPATAASPTTLSCKLEDGEAIALMISPSIYPWTYPTIQASLESDPTKRPRTMTVTDFSILRIEVAMSINYTPPDEKNSVKKPGRLRLDIDRVSGDMTARAQGLPPDMKHAEPDAAAAWETLWTYKGHCTSQNAAF